MALNIENIVAELKEATILELNDLVKAIEEEFGVSAAAPVAVAAAGGAAAAEEQTEFTVELTAAGDQKVKVIKNSILSRAAKKAGLEGMDEVFTGPTAVAFSNEDVVAPAKIMDEFAKEAKALEIKGGIIEGKVSSLEEITALAKLPNREGLLSMLLSVLQAPVRNVAYAVKAVADKEDGDAA